jgi:hypothetical protein
MYRKLEEYLSQEENFSSPVKEEQLRKEQTRLKLEIEDFQRQIEENELIRLNLEERARANYVEKASLESGLHVPDDPRDSIIKQL